MTSQSDALPDLAEDGLVAELVDGLVDDVTMLRGEVAHLREALAGRACIDQAKGMLMMRYSIDADRAFALLVHWSQNLNVKLRVVARVLVTVVGGSAGLPGPETDLQRAVVAHLRRGDGTSSIPESLATALDSPSQPATTMHHGQARAYGGPVHGQSWHVDADSPPSPTVDLTTDARVVRYQLVHHPRTGLPARDHRGNYLYMPTVQVSHTGPEV